MDYQQVLTIPYIFNLMNILINKQSSNKNNQKKIVKVNNTFYLEDNKKNLYLIQEYMGKSFERTEIEKLLDTFIYFEKYKKKPIDSYINLRFINKYNNLYLNDPLEYDLLTALQQQYATNKSYFE
tara:strand:- start:317 stop:691 length:375 start_codon:yes stop_codon:yes gene_type:complete